MEHRQVSENFLHAVTFGGRKFVAVGASGALVVSTNGTDWQSLLNNHLSSFTAVTHREGLWIASGYPPDSYRGFGFIDPSVVISTNGTDWEATRTETWGFDGLASAPQRFVGVHDGCIYTTTNGIDWSSNCVATTTLREVVYEDGLFVAAGTQGTVLTSVDGLTWNDSSVPTGSEFNSVVRGEGR